ncbi:MAG: hypothetical protein EPN85_03230 [Bacteroidetes bacterium]|nr:MAG: hypothetical protein EPN85_03230 [Bacteroidota bacterium]
MNEFDIFCSNLLEESKRFLEKSKNEKNEDGKKAYQHSCLLLSICSLEAYINGISEEMTLANGFPIHFKGILLEKEIRIDKGEFILSDTLKMSRLTERIEILYRRYSRKKISDSNEWWAILKQGIDLRNKITHPKENIELTDILLEKILQSVIECLTAIYRAVYKNNFPKSNLSLTSKLNF